MKKRIRLCKRLSFVMAVCMLFSLNTTFLAADSSVRQAEYLEEHYQINFKDVDYYIVDGNELIIDEEDSRSFWTRNHVQSEIDKLECALDNSSDMKEKLIADLQEENELMAVSIAEAPVRLVEDHYERIATSEASTYATAQRRVEYGQAEKKEGNVIMKNKMKKILIATSAILFLGIVASFIEYVFYTYPANDMKKYCLSNSNENSVDYYSLGVNKLEGYRFWVAKNEEDVYQQEMFIFRKELLWGIFDLERYSLVKQVVGSKEQMVSSVRFDAQSQFADEETTVILFFSSNPKMITHYKIKFQENGVYGEITGGVSQEEPFVVGIMEVGNHDYISRVYEGAEFYDEDYQILEIEE